MSSTEQWRTPELRRSYLEMCAKQDFYRALYQQAERAKRGEAPLPAVPVHSELEFTDGFLMWNGRPVWWSGESKSPALTAGLKGPGIIDPDLVSQPLAAPAPSPQRGRLRRLLGLRLRWA